MAINSRHLSHMCITITIFYVDEKGPASLCCVYVCVGVQTLSEKVAPRISQFHRHLVCAQIHIVNVMQPPMQITFLVGTVPTFSAQRAKCPYCCRREPIRNIGSRQITNLSHMSTATPKHTLEMPRVAGKKQEVSMPYPFSF